MWQGMLVYTYNPSNEEAGAGELSVQGQTEPSPKTISPQKRNKR